MQTVIHTDGAARGQRRKGDGPASSGFVAFRDGKLVHSYAATIGSHTNNYAEYQAVILALQWAKATQQLSVHIKSDSELIVKQVTGQYTVKNAGLYQLYGQVIVLLATLSNFKIEWIPRALNEAADEICNTVLDHQRTLGGEDVAYVNGVLYVQ